MKNIIITIIGFMFFVTAKADLSTFTITKVWGKNSASSTLPSWFGTDVTRGLAVKNQKLYLVTRDLTTTPKSSKVRIVNALTFSAISSLNVDGIKPVGHSDFALNDVETSDDGQILACNLELGADTLRVYKWTSDASIPTILLEYIALAGVRLGDLFTVKGSMATGQRAYIYFATYESNKVYLWSTTGGVLDSQIPQVITVSPLNKQHNSADNTYHIANSFGTCPKVYPLGEGMKDGLIVNGNATYPSKCDSTGKVIDSTNYGNMNWSHSCNNAIVAFTSNNKTYMATAVKDGYSNNAKLFVKDISKNMNDGKALWGESIGTAVNGNWTGDVAFDTIGGKPYIFMLWTNNGILAYRMDIVDKLPFSQAKICIDPGHGGHNTSDDRYMASTGFWESDGNVVKALYLKTLLEKYGAKVVLTRSSNTDSDADAVDDDIDISLSTRAEIANSNNVDFFQSIHSNGGDAKSNYTLMLFRGYDSAPVFAEAKDVSQIAADISFARGISWNNSKMVKGDWTFYDWGTQGLGVLRPLAMPGFLSEGSFHDYVPESWRLLNSDYCHYESYLFLRTYLQFFNNSSAETTGLAAGIIRDKSSNVSYTSISGSNDIYSPLNGTQVTLLPENKTYNCDNLNNGFFMFENLTPGTHKLVFVKSGIKTDTVSINVTANKTSFTEYFVTKTAVTKKYDTLSVTEFAQGMKLLKMRDNTIPTTFSIVEADLSNKNLQIVPCLANDSLGRDANFNGGADSRETVQNMALRRKTLGDSVLAAVNADFFDMTNGTSCNMFVKDGMIASYNKSFSTASAMMVDTSGVPYIAIADFVGAVNINGFKDTVNTYNQMRYADYLNVFNPFLAPHINKTMTNDYGTEVVVNFDKNRKYFNNRTTTYTVQSLYNKGNTPFLANQMVFSGHGTAQNFLKLLTVGSTFTYTEKLKGITQPIKHLVGGCPQVVKSGQNYVTQGVANEPTIDASIVNTRHPRSGAGYSQDKSKFYLFAINGRTTGNLGMTLNEEAQLMMDMGVYDGMNFDGGGSTMLWANGSVANSPSEYRKVANSLMITFKKSTQTDINSNVLQENNNKIYVYPNPVEDVLKFSSDFDLDDLSVKIFDIQGKLVKIFKITSNVVNISDLNSGVYLYLFQFGNKNFTGKFVKK